MENLDARKISLIPIESRTELDNELYSVYCSARDCTTGSMVQLARDLGMSATDFYARLDTDLSFREAIMQGLSDSRRFRLVELESALIQLALGTTVEEVRELVREDESGVEHVVDTVRTHKQLPPNLQAVQLLLERYQGSAWTVSQRVQTDEGLVQREIDYSILSKAQLKKLAGEGDKK